MPIITVADRIKLFYTPEGIVGKSALELELEALKPFDNAIELYESSNQFDKELYWLAIGLVESIYMIMDTQYRAFFDLIKRGGDNLGGDKGALMQALLDYHQYVVTYLTEELKRRKKHFYVYRFKYYAALKKASADARTEGRLETDNHPRSDCGRADYTDARAC